VIVDRRLLAYLDWPLLIAILLLSLVGLVTVYSVTWDLAADAPGREFWMQVYALPVGLTALAVCLAIDYRTLAERSWLFYGALVVGLLVVWQFGAVRGGARRWLPLGPVSLQPSEFARMILALTLAMYFGAPGRSAGRLSHLAGGAALVVVPMLLIVRQPDLGTSAMLVPVYVGIVFVAGLRLRWLAWAALAFVLLSPAIWTYGMDDYQRERIETFLNPASDPRGSGYQQIQAKITVGSGGLLGKGFREGTQGGYGYLPEAHNDLVFSAFAEEWGFLGVLVALGLYLFVLIRSVDAARLARDRLGALLVVGIVSGFGFHVLYNITMSAGLAPVKGLTLPLMSYGGSSLVATLAALGLILNVRMRRFVN
jgi:rod shape determining protein RodA